MKNLELWNLEDEARRKDVKLSYIGEIKRKIDLCNQQRNDYMDKIDELLAKKIMERK
jgi:penicillin-binding protein-related factor A (putative recombinase)